MINETSQKLFEELDAILESERQALLSGKLDEIGLLLERKERAIENISVLEDLNSSDFTALTGKMKRNQVLLDSALEGIRSVASRLAELRRVKRSLDTYTSTGKKQSIDIGDAGKVEKRA